MRIVWHRVTREGKDYTVAFIDTGNIDLGIYTIFPIRNMDQSLVTDEEVKGIEELDEDDDDERDDIGDDLPIEVIPPVTTDDGPFDLSKLYFYVETFKKLRTSQTLWDQLLLAANRFFSLLPEYDQQQLCLFYIEARRTIDREFNGGSITDIATFLGNRFYDIAVDINLPDKLMDYVQNHSGIPIPPLEYAGTNASRDTEEMTFREDEYYVLLAISVVCKILCPVWGDLIQRTVGIIDNEMKETHYMNIIEPFLTLGKFKVVRDKLYNYVANTIDTARRGTYSTASFAATIGGVSSDRFYHIVFSTLIVKRYVTVDLYTPVGADGRNGNITIWTWTCAKNSFTSLQQTLNRRCKIMPRLDIFDKNEYGGGDEENKISHLEHGSRITEVTADTPVLIRFGVKMAISRLKEKYSISEIEYHQALDYYIKNRIQVTTFNKILVGVFFGNDIGGAQGLKYLDLSTYTELVTITQIYIATQYEYYDVVQLLTATTPSGENVVPALYSVNTRIAQTARQTREHRDCESSFPFTIGKVNIPTVLKRIQDYIVRYHHYTNTAPMISAIMDRDPVKQGSLILYDDLIMQQCCDVILNIINPAARRVIKEKQAILGV